MEFDLLYIDVHTHNICICDDKHHNRYAYGNCIE